MPLDYSCITNLRNNAKPATCGNSWCKRT